MLGKSFECFFVNGRIELAVAHELAQYAVRADDFKSGIEEEPSWLSSLLLSVDSSKSYFHIKNEIKKNL